MTQTSYSLIDLNYLAGYFCERLGSGYRVEVDSVPYPESNTDITVVSLQAQRVPFAIRSVKSETLTVSLNFRLKLEPERYKHKVLADMRRLLGCQSFCINTYREEESGAVADKTYNVVSYLDLQKPLTDPQIDTGEIYADYQISGTILVTDSTDGTMISNDIVTELSERPISGEIEESRMLAVVSCQVTHGKSVETYHGTACDRLTAVTKTQSCAYGITALCQNREIDRNLIRSIELQSGGSRVYYLRRTYPNGIVSSKKCLLTDGSITEQAGAYCQYAISLQEVTE